VYFPSPGAAGKLLAARRFSALGDDSKVLIWNFNQRAEAAPILAADAALTRRSSTVMHASSAGFASTNLVSPVICVAC